MPEPADLIREHLRGIHSRLRVIHGSQATHGRLLSAIEIAIQRHRADLAADATAAIRRPAAIEERIGIIERRLELRDR